MRLEVDSPTDLPNLQVRFNADQDAYFVDDQGTIQVWFGPQKMDEVRGQVLNGFEYRLGDEQRAAIENQLQQAVVRALAPAEQQSLPPITINIPEGLIEQHIHNHMPTGKSVVRRQPDGSIEIDRLEDGDRL
jgi:hypothetical protein